MKFKYISIVSSLVLISLLSIYQHFQSELADAYKYRNYHKVKYLTSKYHKIIPNAHELAIKSAFEESIEKQINKTGIKIVCPTAQKIELKLHYITEKEWVELKTPWLKFYFKTLNSDYEIINAINSLDEVDMKKQYPWIFKKAAQEAKKLDFRYKQIYINSCYTYSLASYLLAIQKRATRHFMGYQRAYYIAGGEYWVENILKFTNDEILFQQKHKENITQYYYTEMEKVFYNTLINNEYLYHNATDHTEDIDCLQLMNKGLFNLMKTYSKDRNMNYPRNKNEKKRYKRLEILIDSYYQ